MNPKIWEDNNHVLDKSGVDEKIIRLLKSKLNSLTDENPNLFVFPEDSLIKNQRILEYNWKSPTKLSTTNLMGVMNFQIHEKDPVKISIRSRFDKSDKQTFLLWMLMSAFDGNIVDWKTDVSDFNVWDILLIFLFKHYLGKSFKQGLFKQYMLKRYNNYNFRGVLDVNKYIMANIPFVGKISHKIKEFS